MWQRVQPRNADSPEIEGVYATHFGRENAGRGVITPVHVGQDFVKLKDGAWLWHRYPRLGELNRESFDSVHLWSEQDGLGSVVVASLTRSQTVVACY